MGIYPEFIGCQSPPAISFVGRDARVCLAIQDALSTRGNSQLIRTSFIKCSPLTGIPHGYTFPAPGFER
jgi:hypothetical protein